jgi:hypothetical protein
VCQGDDASGDNDGLCDDIDPPAVDTEDVAVARGRGELTFADAA